MRLGDLLLGFVCLGFAALAAWPWLPAARTADIAVAAAPLPPVAEADLALPPLAAFAATLERPLFSATRSPPPRGAVESAGGLVLGRYRLTGVMIARDHTAVLLRPAAGGKVIRLVQGQELDGWKVVAITADHIVLSAEGREQKIALGRGGRP